MSVHDDKPIDFSSLPTLEPRNDSFDAMLARRASRQQRGNTIVLPMTTIHSPVRPYWASAIAAMLVVGIGLGAWLGLRDRTASEPQATVALLSSSAAQEATETPAISDSAALAEAVEWYGALGGGTSSEPLQVADAMFDSF